MQVWKEIWGISFNSWSVNQFPHLNHSTLRKNRLISINVLDVNFFCINLFFFYLFQSIILGTLCRILLLLWHGKSVAWRWKWPSCVHPLKIWQKNKEPTLVEFIVTNKKYKTFKSWFNSGKALLLRAWLVKYTTFDDFYIRNW